MYDKITGENPYETPMMIYPAVHYTMGGLWVDYNLMTNIEGLFAIGEANFSDHGANRLGASALMQGLADGYFVVPYTIGGYLGSRTMAAVDASHPAFDASQKEISQQVKRLLEINGKQTVTQLHRRLGKILWDYCGIARNEEGLNTALGMIRELREEFYNDVNVPGEGDDFNQNLENAGRVADFMELAELMVIDALNRKESCGCHLNTAYLTEDNEPLRDDENFAMVAAWEYAGEGREPLCQKEPLIFENVELTQRSYK